MKIKRETVEKAKTNFLVEQGLLPSFQHYLGCIITKIINGVYTEDQFLKEAPVLPTTNTSTPFECRVCGCREKNSALHCKECGTPLQFNGVRCA